MNQVQSTHISPLREAVRPADVDKLHDIGIRDGTVSTGEVIADDREGEFHLFSGYLVGDEAALLGAAVVGLCFHDFVI